MKKNALTLFAIYVLSVLFISTGHAEMYVDSHGNVGIGRTSTSSILELYSPVSNHPVWIGDAYLLWLESGGIGNPLNSIQVIKSYEGGESEIRFDNGDDMLAALFTYSNYRALNFLVGGIVDGGQVSLVTLENRDSLGDLKVQLRAASTNESALVFGNIGVDWWADFPTDAYASKIYRPANSQDLVVNLSGTGDVMIFDSITGNIGMGTLSPTEKLHVNGNVTADDYLVNSSRLYKEQVETLSADKALSALNDLKPVTFKFKNDKEENHVGFIAEDVPDLVATKERKGLSPMDIVAVLTKVVQEQQKTIEHLNAEIKGLKKN